MLAVDQKIMDWVRKGQIICLVCLIGRGCVCKVTWLKVEGGSNGVVKAVFIEGGGGTGGSTHEHFPRVCKGGEESCQSSKCNRGVQEIRRVFDTLLEKRLCSKQRRM
eukprot:Sspe_Gene.25743::Locus_10420_Transcript_1_1_Confidence_1.000_Length_547::g.25743::m.25743